MAKDIRETLSAKKVLIHVVDKIADMSVASFTDNPLINFFNKYYGAGASSFVDLGFDETIEVTDLTASDRYGYRLDHTATDFSLGFPKISAEKKSYLGTKDSAGTSNSTMKVEDPDFATVEVTFGGMPFDLDRLTMSDAAVSPTGWQRYNSGSRPGKFGLIVAVISNPEAPTDADNISEVHFLNNVEVIDGGEIKASGGADFERTMNFQCDASDHIKEVVLAQNTNAVINK